MKNDSSSKSLLLYDNSIRERNDLKMKIKKILKKLVKQMVSQNNYIRVLRKFYGMSIGKNTYIDKSALIGTEPYLISIGDNVRITQGVEFITHDGSLWVLRNLGKVDKNTDKFGRIKIGNNVNIGWNTIIMPNVTIGDNVMIGAGSIVTKNIPSNSVAVGVPAKVIESVDEYYEKNKEYFMITKMMKAKEKKKYLDENLR